MAAVKKLRRHQRSEVQKDSHGQIFVAGYLDGFDDCLIKIIEASGNSVGTYLEIEAFTQVQSRTESY